MSAALKSPGGIPTIDVQEAARRQSQTQAPAPASTLIDVREMNEYVELRAENSTLMPLSELGTRFTELPRDGSLMLVCRSGGRSAQAAAFLAQQGFSDVSNVEGGMIAWQRAGLATRTGPLDPGEGDL